MGNDEVTCSGPAVPRGEEILTGEALAFVLDLHDRFAQRRDELLAVRRERRARIAGEGLDFLDETRAVREDPDWRVAPAPADLTDRRVEITGPTDRKMVVNALNSGARVFMADFEDSNSPTWPNLLGGQVNLSDAIARRIDFTSEQGKRYALGDTPATLVVRPRGWHLPERRVLVRGKPAVGALVDFGLYFFHNARTLLDAGSGPYFYLPKMESHLEARLWNDVFTHAQSALSIPHGSIRATVLIETLPAAFEMEEILYELRDHASGLNAGRWDYIFSAIKSFGDAGPEMVLPDRDRVTMTVPFMRAYTSCWSPRATAAVPSRWEGWRRSSRTGGTPRSRSERSRRCARTRAGRPPTASTGRWWPTRTSSRSLVSASTTCCATGPTSSTASVPTSRPARRR